MTRYSKSYPFRRLWALSFLLPLLCACSLVNDKDDPAEPSIQPTSDHYINLSIVVSSGNENTMRAPQGGEDGDGREAGFERENKVTGITFMLYEKGSEDNINTSLDKTLSYIKYYPVTPVSREEEDAQNNIEAVYTTGDQPLDDLDLTKIYGVIVVANANLTGKFNKQTTVKDVCDYEMTTIYGGSGIGAEAGNFVMSLEEDYTIDFKNLPFTTVNGVTYYTFDNIIIERLAARMDFWTKGATYNAERNGYEYSVKMNTEGTGQDVFVLTAVTPFNLYNGTATEYLIKHVNIGDSEIKYIEDETKTTFVVDPKTDQKTVTTELLGLYDNTLKSLLEDNTPNIIEGSNLSTQTLHELTTASTTLKDGYTTIDGKPNFILCYPKENTLKDGSSLYYFATGLRIEGDYYTNGEGEPQHLTYYGYLRHQGEKSEGYYLIVTGDKLDTSTTGTSDTAMNFGVVRNNIYRISIDEITEKGTEDPKITLRIVVKNWDEFKHDTIYM